MVTPISWLERVPTYKDQQAKLQEKNLSNYGFLGYPVLQSADVLAYKADFVPVGEDQISHIELIREIARKFNHLYGAGKVILPDPKVLLSNTPKLPGLDGRKMSKSYNNTIQLTEDPKSIETKIKTMQTDPARVRRTDPGTPEKCPVWYLHKVYSSDDTKEWVQKGCTTAGIGCLDCKGALLTAILQEQKPILARYEELNRKPEIVERVIKDGNEKARYVASATLHEVRDAMGLTN
jgi:tryptophanyl-tRNA synthetase